MPSGPSGRTAYVRRGVASDAVGGRDERLVASHDLDRRALLTRRDGILRVDLELPGWWRGLTGQGPGGLPGRTDADVLAGGRVDDRCAEQPRRDLADGPGRSGPADEQHPLDGHATSAQGVHAVHE